jgi:methylenetetrahydrofolate--tRNA-(uracil-5-)-methyltransferase
MQTTKANKNNSNSRVLIIGAGLAGSEAAYYLAQKNISVILVETKTLKLNPSQKMTTFAELVCTNSLKSKDPTSAHGLLKTEMRKLGSLVLKIGEETAVPAGEALAVDREKFSFAITEVLSNHPNIQIHSMEADDPIELQRRFECDYVIIATGPLTTSKLENWILKNISGDDFYFYDAIAPVVDADTLDFSKMYYKDRWKDNEEKADYLNAPMNKEQYYAFIEELKNAEKVPAKDFEKNIFFESCLPIDVMAERGLETARFSCMKPIGLKMKDGTMPFAVVQLRKENLLGSAFNLVGFQTRLTYKEQVRIFKMIPGFENASFIHLGSVHRNSFLNARTLLNFDLSSKKFPQIHFAGQMTGVEGYTESASMGLYVAFQIARKIEGLSSLEFPKETCFGALINYIMTVEKPSPSNINFGLIPTIELSKEQRKKDRKKTRKLLAAERAQTMFDNFLESNP